MIRTETTLICDLCHTRIYGADTIKVITQGVFLELSDDTVIFYKPEISSKSWQYHVGCYDYDKQVCEV
jgi:hypothetical protein